MKNFILISMTLFIGCWLFVGCSNDEQSETSTEMKVEILKQKYLYYAGKYGVTNISFNNDMLSRHLWLTDNEVEKDIIQVAICQGVLDTDASSLRNKVRTRSIDPNEGGGMGHEFKTVDGSFTGSTNIGEGLSVTYTIGFHYSEHGHMSATSASAYITRKYKCNNPQCETWHVDPTQYNANIGNILINAPCGNIPGNEGDTAYFTITGSARIYKNDEGFNFNEAIDIPSTNISGIIHVIH